MSSKVTVVFGVITEIEIGGENHSLILQASAGEQKTLKGSIKFPKQLAFTNVIDDLKKQFVGDVALDQKSEDTSNLLKDIGLIPILREDALYF